MLYTLIPVKPLAEAKTRLEEVLTPQERAALVLAMLSDVLNAVRRSGLPGPLAVVSNDPAVVYMAQSLQIGVLPDETSDLNAALLSATQAAANAGAQRVLLLHADLPLLAPADIQLLVGRRTSPTVRLVPARDGGTNAMLTPVPVPIPLLFGQASLRRHRMAARLAGVPFRLIRSPGLVYDVDRPEDLIRLLELPGDTQTQRLVRRMGIIERVMSI